MPAPDPKLWSELLAALRRARGQNALRGHVVAQPDQGRVLVEVPPRGAAAAPLWIVVSVGPYAATVVAQLPDRRRLALTDYPAMVGFVAAVAEAARAGRPYSRTNDTSTDYKPGFRATPPR